MMKAPPFRLTARNEMTMALAINPVFAGAVEERLPVRVFVAKSHHAEMHRRYTTPLTLTPALCDALNHK